MRNEHLRAIEKLRHYSADDPICDGPRLAPFLAAWDNSSDDLSVLGAEILPSYAACCLWIDDLLLWCEGEVSSH